MLTGLGAIFGQSLGRCNRDHALFVVHKVDI
jgi:hypothetical protein